jgi:predicted aspartyl protease
MATKYSHRYIPAMPVLAIRLSAPEETATGPLLTALVDTGADICIAPRALLSRMDVPASEAVRVRGQWGEPLQTTRYLIDVHFEQGVIPAIDVVSDPNGREIILGRNILNKLQLLLDGPAESIEVLPGDER